MNASQTASENDWAGPGTIGIDASNLSARGGGATHLRGVLMAADPTDYGFHKVVVFAGQELLDTLPDRTWLVKLHHRWLDRGLLWRTIWQSARLNAALKDTGCDLLMAPCGNYLGKFRPYIAMSHNLLLFEPGEQKRFGLSLMRLKLFLLALVQRRCFHKASGLIVISDYAKNCIARHLNQNLESVPVIYHGVGERFSNPPKLQRPITSYTKTQPFRLLYVSTISVYKHQDVLVKAVARLMDEGFPIHLDLVGGAYRPMLNRLKTQLSRLSHRCPSIRYHGSVPIDKIHKFYRDADAFVFASTCENMPNILVEAMRAGLPICCSHHGPMPEILANCGIYFSPVSEEDTYRAVRLLLSQENERQRLASLAYAAAERFTWEKCAAQTFDYFQRVYRKHYPVETRISPARSQVERAA